MALSASLRVRRSLTTTLSSLRRSLCSSTSPLSTPPPLSLSSSSLRYQSPPPSSSSSTAAAAAAFQFRSFRTSSIALSQSRRLYQEGDEIGPDTILFEGCDYNHWLITMEFPKDPKPTPEEMVRTYEETCAKGLGISIEEAKKKIYACSTTTYQGFQAIMTEEESEKFRDIPGVVFILPDSYIDPVNKEYGGDKYENGVITHRPPPIQYGRNTGGRFRDRNRNPDQPRYNNQRGSPMANWQGNPGYGQQGTMQGGGRNYGPPENYPSQQNYGSSQNYPPQQNSGPQQNYPPQQNFGRQQNYPPQQNFGHQQNYPPQQNFGPQQNNFGPQQNYPPQQNFGPQQNYPPQQNYGPTPPNNRDYAPGGGGGYQADRNVPMPSYHGNPNQGQQGTYGQGASSSHGQSYPGQGEGQRFSQAEQMDNAPMGQTGTNQERY